MRFAILALVLLLAPLAAAQSDHVVIGFDASGDSVNESAPGVDTTLFAAARTDILAVTTSEDALRMEIGAMPSGTGGYMYAIHWMEGGEVRYVCWNVQWTANEAEATQENLKGCSRFTEGTQMGPGTTADGVVLGDEATPFVAWPFAVDASAMTEIVASTWFRGVSDCCAGSQTDSQYYWNQADRGPDEGSWDAPAPEAPTAAPSLMLDPSDDTDVGPNGTTTRTFTVNSSTEVVFQADVPDGWGHTFEPSTLNGSGNASITITAPEEAEFGTYTFTVHAIAGANASANASFELTFVPNLYEAEPEHPGNHTDPEATDPDGEAAPSEETADSPFPAVLALLALAVVAARRR